MSLVHMKDAVWKKAKKIRGKDPKNTGKTPTATRWLRL